MSIDLSQRVCVITGADRGIGRALVRGFARRGALAVATDIEPPTIPEAAASLAYDVTEPDRAKVVMDEIGSRFGHIDAFVANAGVYPRAPWNQLTPTQWRRVLSVNLDGAWFGAQAAARHMVLRGYGKIVLVTSTQVQTGFAECAHYNAAKAGIIGLTRALARALGEHRIRVNAVMPGAVRTETELHMLPDQDQVAKTLDAAQAIKGRIEPEMIEPVFAYLCSEESDVMTGQVLYADHGWHCY